MAVERRSRTMATIVIAANRLLRIIGCGLVDGGANGAVCASDMKLVGKTKRKVNIVGVSNHVIEDKSVVYLHYWGRY